jgi:hypothetical protein
MICFALPGCAVQDDTVTCPSADWVDFVFPFDTGTTWNYTYRFTFANIVVGLVQVTSGRQVWRSIGPETPNSVKIPVARIDTTRTWNFLEGSDTTTKITRLDTSFSIIVSPDSLYIHYYQIGAGRYRELSTLPRMVEQSTDTLTLQLGGGSHYLRATYVSGKGSRHGRITAPELVPGRALDPRVDVTVAECEPDKDCHMRDASET